MSLVRLLLASALLAACGGCSLLVDFEQCQQAQDCPSALACVDGLCAAPPPSSSLGGPCQDALGPIDSPDAIRLGLIAPLSGDEQAVGLAARRAVTLAQEEFAVAGGVRGRPVAVLLCDSQSNDEGALAAANHLLHAARINAIIGPDTSSQARAVAALTIPARALLMSPSATEASLAALEDEDLFWRTALSDLIQGQALGQLAASFAQDAAQGVTRVAIVLPQQDAYSDGLLAAIMPRLDAAAGLTLSQHRYNPTDRAEDNRVAQEVRDAQAQLVILLGFSESWDIIAQIDAVTDDPSLQFLMADAARSAADAARALGARAASLNGRAFGTTPQTRRDQYLPFVAFSARYNQRFQQNASDAPFVAQAYDALYLLAIAIAAQSDASGLDIARGLRQLNAPGGARFSPGASAIPELIAALDRDEPVRFGGVSGALNFNDAGEPASGAISLWCLQGSALPERAAPVLSEEGVFTPQRCVMPGGE